jgi:hypothetical protein
VVKVVGFSTFGLILHLPYLVLRELNEYNSSLKCSGTEWQANEFLFDLNFLPIESSVGRQPGRFRIHKEQTTVVISGCDHFKWHGYAFGKLGSSSIDEEDGDDDNDTSDSEDEDDDAEPVEDIFASGGCGAVINPDKPELDPRIYFLVCAQFRLETVSQSYEYLVRKLDTGFSSWVSFNNLWDTFNNRSLRSEEPERQQTTLFLINDH